ncbi:fungal-specific transcription factor domain-domain-containing protein [Absidia repens]|uniref:Fungal-specific transcription factor domain-domain-containing protein n=1 Tax=Absidia repens TaxID=90262 RepID=A0A1X2IUD4_9FUNG|nr:fungal-specific transcription factor domain-domain-containing protein [Absidia repens]
MFATLELPLRDDSRHKRLQGGRACHPCRMKKIKCDGKQPCMQCKARRRKCSFVKNAGDSYIRLDDSLSANGDNTSNMDTTENEGQSRNHIEHLFAGQGDASIRHKEAGQQFSIIHQRNGESSTRTEKLVEQLTDGLTRLALNQQNDPSSKTSALPSRTSSPIPPSTTSSSTVNPKNITPWLSYGGLIRWTPEQYPPANYTVLLDLPSRAVQEQLIGTFFTHCHHLLPTLSRRLFYDQLEMKGSLITPLLLNIMYAHASRHSPLYVHQSGAFYSRARQLIDDFMDIPRMSTVLALLYLAAYDEGTRSSRSWMYSGMAVRMALDLGLYRANYYSNEMSQFDVELRKRVLWTCYVMDQLYSSLMERPPMLSFNIISLDLPTPLPEDNDQERLAVAALSQLCRLVMILEKVVHYFLTRHSSQQQTNKSWTDGLLSADADDEQQVMVFLNDIKHWHDLLPHSLTWYDDDSIDTSNGHSGNDNGISTQRHQHNKQGQHQHWAVVNLHLLAFILELSLLLCCRYPTLTDRGHYLIRSTSQLVSWTLHYPHLRVSKALTAYSGLFCTSVLLVHHSTDKLQPEIKWESSDSTYTTLRQCLMDVRQCIQNIPEQDIQRFSHLVETILSPSIDYSHNSAFGSSLMDATMEAAAAAVVTATGVVGGDHDLDLLSSVSPLNDTYLGQYDSPSILHHHHNERQHYEKRDSTMTAASNHTAFVTPIFDKPFDHLSHALPIPTARTVETNTTVMMAPSSPRHQQHHQQMTPSTSSSRSSFGLTPLTNPSSSKATSKQHRNQHHSNSIEPADYTFELISVADEWARSLAYDTQQIDSLGSNRSH